MTAPLLSLITGTVNRPDSYRRLIQSIETHTAVPYEVIVADASDDPIYTAETRSIVVLSERPRTTCVQGYNAAFRRATGTWVMFLNDDAEVTEGYDRNAIRFMDDNPNIGVGALHYSENGGPFHVNAAWGCTYANFGILRRALGDAVGWFDEDLVMYGSDNSLCLRVLLRGHGIADIPNARIIHHSVKDAVRTENQLYRSRDNETLTRKYMPLKDQWRMAFNLNRIYSGWAPWVHGVNPELKAQ